MALRYMCKDKDCMGCEGCWQLTLDWIADKGYEIMLPGQRKAPAAPDDTQRRAQLAAEPLETPEIEELRVSQVVHLARYLQSAISIAKPSMVHLAHAINIFNKGFSHSKAGLRSEVGCTTDARIVTTQYVRQQILPRLLPGRKSF